MPSFLRQDLKKECMLKLYLQCPELNEIAWL